ncbi:MAG: transporter substrate-binding domain-containing protein [Candidatus Heimdallarchaeota archaeon]|nr:transporter substrate-binding domain-containing protein [Candidatus Heimdallarchaeota archaeon]
MRVSVAYNTILSMIFIVLISIHSTPATAQIEETIYVGAYDNVPKVFPEGDSYVGIFPDLLNYIANEEGWNLEYVTCLWSECLEKLEANEINIMVDMGYSDARAEIYDFNKVPVITNWAMSYSSKDKTYSYIEDLNNTVISVLKGSIHTDGENGIKALLNSFHVNATYLEVSSYLEVLQKIEDGVADFGVVNRLFGMVNEKDFNNIQRSFLVFNPVNLHFGFYKGSDLTNALIERIDAHLLNLIGDLDSEYYEILNTYLYELEGGVPEWILPSILGFIGLIAALIGLNIIFKKQLNKKTEELQQFIKDQDEQINVAIEDLVVANERLRELDRLKSIFLASMSHELRTPLNSIIGFTRILLMGMGGELNEEQTKQLTMVEKSSKHLLNLINDVLDISKIESETIQLYYEEFELHTLLEEVVKSVKPQIEEKNLRITLYINQEISVFTDQRRVQQILINLVSNATKFTSEGEIMVTQNVQDQFFYITVKDPGIGIKKEDQAGLFKPFMQVDMSSTKKYEGTGLGLYICKKLCKLLGGDIEMESDYNKGTTVRFYLPIRGEQPDEKNISY